MQGIPKTLSLTVDEFGNIRLTCSRDGFYCRALILWPERRKPRPHVLLAGVGTYDPDIVGLTKWIREQLRGLSVSSIKLIFAATV